MMICADCQKDITDNPDYHECLEEREAARKAKYSNATRSYYDYDYQCWVVSGLVVRCGHSELIQGCYACEHHGEKV